MKLLKDILTLGSTLATATTSTTSAVVEAGSSYASEWRKDRQLETAKSTLARAAEWHQLNEAIESSGLNVKAKSEALEKLKDFE